MLKSKSPKTTCGGGKIISLVYEPICLGVDQECGGVSQIKIFSTPEVIRIFSLKITSTRLLCDTIGRISQSPTTFFTPDIVGTIEWE